MIVCEPEPYAFSDEGLYTAFGKYIDLLSGILSMSAREPTMRAASISESNRTQLRFRSPRADA